MADATHTEGLTIIRPDDWHVHLRDGAMLARVAPYTARQFARAVVMPNLEEPVTTVHMARAYRARILDAVPEDADFTPLMTCYLTDETDAAELEAGHSEGVFFAAKLYPAGATTNSARGVTDLAKMTPVFEKLQEIGMPLLIHAEEIHDDVDVFDREKVFIDNRLTPLIAQFPELRVVIEHITSDHTVAFVNAAATHMPGRIGATITAHHLILDRSAMFEGGIRPHYFCAPVAKRRVHRDALRGAATSGKECFFLGTDSAPHPISLKEAECGCAGIFTAPAALALYAQVFEASGALDQLEAFASLNGAAFYGLPVNQRKISLLREDPGLPEEMAAADGAEAVKIFGGGDRGLNWRLA